MIPRFKLHERLLCCLLFRYEARHDLGGGFYELNMEAMKWLIDNNYMSFGEVCSLMRDYAYVRMTRELEKERRNG